MFCHVFGLVNIILGHIYNYFYFCVIFIFLIIILNIFVVIFLFLYVYKLHVNTIDICILYNQHMVVGI
jgi:hypothetical protein